MKNFSEESKARFRDKLANSTLTDKQRSFVTMLFFCQQGEILEEIKQRVEGMKTGGKVEKQDFDGGDACDSASYLYYCKVCGGGYDDCSCETQDEVLDQIIKTL